MFGFCRPSSPSRLQSYAATLKVLPLCIPCCQLDSCEAMGHSAGSALCEGSEVFRGSVMLPFAHFFRISCYGSECQHCHCGQTILAPTFLRSLQSRHCCICLNAQLLCLQHNEGSPVCKPCCWAAGSLERALAFKHAPPGALIGSLTDHIP